VVLSLGLDICLYRGGIKYQHHRYGSALYRCLCLVVGRLGFDSLVKSDQNTFKCEDRPASSLVVSLGKAFNGINCLYLCMVKMVVTGGSLTRRSQRSLRCIHYKKQGSTALDCQLTTFAHVFSGQSTQFQRSKENLCCLAYLHGISPTGNGIPISPCY